MYTHFMNNYNNTRIGFLSQGAGSRKRITESKKLTVSFKNRNVNTNCC